MVEDKTMMTCSKTHHTLINHHKRYNNKKNCSTHGGDILDRHPCQTSFTSDFNHIWHAKKVNYHIVGGIHTKMYKDILTGPDVGAGPNTIDS